MDSLTPTSFHLDPSIQMPTYYRSKSVVKGSFPGSKSQMRKLEQEDTRLKLLKMNNNSWMRKRGKNSYTGFNSNEKTKVATFFNELDADQSGGLTLSELYEPLLSLGLAENKEEVRAIFKRVDKQEDSVINFEEFRRILEAEKVSRTALSALFHKLINAKQREHLLPYKVQISTHRRRLMLQAFTARTPKDRERGQSVLKAYAEELNSPTEEVHKDKVLEAKRISRLNSLKQPIKRRGIQSYGLLPQPKSPNKINRSIFRQYEKPLNLSVL